MGGLEGRRQGLSASLSLCPQGPPTGPQGTHQQSVTVGSQLLPDVPGITPASTRRPRGPSNSAPPPWSHEAESADWLPPLAEVFIAAAVYSLLTSFRDLQKHFPALRFLHGVCSGTALGGGAGGGSRCRRRKPGAGEEREGAGLRTLAPPRGGRNGHTQPPLCAALPRATSKNQPRLRPEPDPTGAELGQRRPGTPPAAF